MKMKDDINVFVLGPAGTFSHEAALKYFGEKEFIFMNTVWDIFNSITDTGDYGLVPMENFLMGSVGEVLDYFVDMGVMVSGEINLPLVQNLIGKTDEIEKIVSHSKAIEQCRKFLRENYPDVPLEEVASTAKAAEQVSVNPGQAAIGSELAAKLYGLKILEKKVQDSESNVTRFLVISKKDHKPTGNDKTSIVFYTKKDVPGILWRILGGFAKRDISLTKIESRPSKRAMGDYYFFIDFEGHREDKEVGDALDEGREYMAWLKVLGSYPIHGK